MSQRCKHDWNHPPTCPHCIRESYADVLRVAEAARDLFEAKERDRHRDCGDLSGNDEQDAEEALLKALKKAGYPPRTK
jgi:hypothetical protein